jgi:hypothetical protein
MEFSSREIIEGPNRDIIFSGSETLLESRRNIAELTSCLNDMAAMKQIIAEAKERKLLQNVPKWF